MPAFETTSPIYTFYIQRSVLQADAWVCHGFSCFTYSSQSVNGGNEGSIFLYYFPHQKSLILWATTKPSCNLQFLKKKLLLHKQGQNRSFLVEVIMVCQIYSRALLKQVWGNIYRNVIKWYSQLESTDSQTVCSLDSAAVIDTFPSCLEGWHWSTCRGVQHQHREEHMLKIVVSWVCIRAH